MDDETWCIPLIRRKAWPIIPLSPQSKVHTIHQWCPSTNMHQHAPTTQCTHCPAHHTPATSQIALRPTQQCALLSDQRTPTAIHLYSACCHWRSVFMKTYDFIHRLPANRVWISDGEKYKTTRGKLKRALNTVKIPFPCWLHWPPGPATSTITWQTCDHMT